MTIDTQNVRYWDGYEFTDTSYTNMYYTDWSPSPLLREELRKRQVSARETAMAPHTLSGVCSHLLMLGIILIRPRIIRNEWVSGSG